MNNCMNAIDANILLYGMDTKEPAKQGKAATLLCQLTADPQKTTLLWQVLVESINQLRRWENQGHVTKTEFDAHVQYWRTLFPMTFPTIRVLDHALDLAKRYSLSHWDSLILGACKEAGVTTLYTEDMGAPRTIDGIQLFNPLI